MKVTLRWLAQQSIELLLIVSFFCPYYIYTTNKMTITFSLTCCLALLSCCIVNRFQRESAKSHVVYSIILCLYCGVFLFTNILYIKCYWELANRLICFLLFLSLVYKGERVFRGFKIENKLFAISWLAVIFSIILYFFNIEELSFAGGISYRIQGQHFTDTRLTYVFSHKSGYGLILFMLLFYALNNSEKFRSKFFYCIYVLTILLGIVLSGSASTWISVSIMVLCILMGKLKQRMNTRIFLALCILILASPYFFYKMYGYLLVNRNLSTGGSRFLIWTAAFDYLRAHFIGLGNSYYSTFINGVNNFHNVFLNEMLHFSVLVGVIYVCLFAAIICMSYRNHKYSISKWFAFWLPVMLLLMIDQSLVVSNMPLFMVMVYLIMFYNAGIHSPAKYRHTIFGEEKI